MDADQRRIEIPAILRRLQINTVPEHYGWEESGSPFVMSLFQPDDFCEYLSTRRPTVWI